MTGAIAPPNRPTVALDIRMLRHSGIGTYVQHLAQGLSEQAGAGPIQYRMVGPKRFFSNGLANFLPASPIEWDAPIYSVSEQCQYALMKKRWDVWHCPHYNVPFLKKGRLVVTVHDMIPLKFAGRFFNSMQVAYARFCFDRIRRSADAVIAVSHCTKKDLMELAGIAPEKITVIHEGVSSAFKPITDSANLADLKAKYQLDKDFLLYVGNIKPHKNVSQLVRVFQSLKSQGAICENLLLVGRPDKDFVSHDPDLQAALRDPSIRFLPQISAQDLPGLYNLARALILPSLYEGFGLVVLEAMACGTPVLVSNRGSLPEIAGNAALVFDPVREDSLASALQSILQDQEVRKHLMQLGLELSASYSWEKMVQQTVKVYEGVSTTVEFKAVTNCRT